MGDVQTGSQSSGLSSPEMRAAASTIGTQLNNNLSAGVKPYLQPLYPGLSNETKTAANSLFSNPNDPAFSAGVSGALGQQAEIAQGNFGNDPVRQRLMQDVSQNVNSSFLTDGRFGSMGSGAHSDVLAREMAGALAPYDMARQQQGIQNMGTLYGMSNMPAAAQLQAGQIFDANALAQRQADADYWDRTQNAGIRSLERIVPIFTGSAPASGTTTTESQPWWKVGGSMALGGLSLFG